MQLCSMKSATEAVAVRPNYPTINSKTPAAHAIMLGYRTYIFCLLLYGTVLLIAPEQFFGLWLVLSPNLQWLLFPPNLESKLDATFPPHTFWLKCPPRFGLLSL